MSNPNTIHLLPERDRMMAETYSQNADGSANPTGEAKPQDAPHVIESTVPTQEPGMVVGKVVESSKAAEKPKGSATAATKKKR